MIRKTNSFPTDQSRSFTEAVTWSYTSARGHGWSQSWRGFIVTGHLTRSESWSNGWTSYWKRMWE